MADSRSHAILADGLRGSMRTPLMSKSKHWRVCCYCKGHTYGENIHQCPDKGVMMRAAIKSLKPAPRIVDVVDEDTPQ